MYLIVAFTNFFPDIKSLPKSLPPNIQGLHFHVLCESSAAALVQVLKIFEKKFKRYLPNIKWINMGGGHLITKEGYDVELLINTLKYFKNAKEKE